MLRHRAARRPARSAAGFLAAALLLTGCSAGADSAGSASDGSGSSASGTGVRSGLPADPAQLRAKLSAGMQPGDKVAGFWLAEFGGRATIAKPDGRLEYFYLDDGTAAGQAVNAGFGSLSVDEVPLDQFFAEHQRGRAYCQTTYGPTRTVVSTLDVTPSGAAAIGISCGTDQGQEWASLGGEPVAELPDIDSAASLTTAFADYQRAYGDTEPNQLWLHYATGPGTDGVADVSFFQPVGDYGTVRCAPRFERNSRVKGGAGLRLLCDRDNGIAGPGLRLSEVAPEQLASVVARAKTDLGVAPADLDRAEVRRDGTAITVTLRSRVGQAVTYDLSGQRR
ncbi:hypothetical protein [Granulicoccus phenolivorans]|uniref:hypothetical protein n=1 Tax=Granulicoccus phenolivorans TaxID=266854 RepID=UPI0004131765|nr:hypothetical protein [Granulicoccus phenolivorans]